MIGRCDHMLIIYQPIERKTTHSTIFDRLWLVFAFFLVANYNYTPCGKPETNTAGTPKHIDCRNNGRLRPSGPVLNTFVASVSCLLLYMGMAVALGIALELPKVCLSKATVQLAERLGHGPSLDEGVTWIEGFNDQSEEPCYSSGHSPFTDKL
jgi:hypothetical protein